MKYKNYKSAIHNFTHSFISLDYTKSSRLAINVLIDLHRLKKETKATFNFLNKTITPSCIDTIESRELLNDYLTWLPKHFIKHQCELLQLEKLETTIWIDFDKIILSENNRFSDLSFYAITTWKAFNKDEQITETFQREFVKTSLLRQGFPELD